MRLDGEPAGARVDLGDLGFDEGGHLLLKRGLRNVPTGGEVEVTGSDPDLDLHLATWCRAEGHLLRPSTGTGPGRAWIVARGRASTVSHDAGTYNAAPSIQACTPVHSAAVTATWQLATLPNVPQYWRATPTECIPCFGKLVASRMTTPERAGMTERSCRHTRATSHGAWLMKC